MWAAISNRHAFNRNGMTSSILDGSKKLFIWWMHNVGAEPSLQLRGRRVSGIIAKVEEHSCIVRDVFVDGGRARVVV